MDKNAVKEDRQGKVPFEYVRKIYKDKDPFTMAKLSGTIYNQNNKTFKLELMGETYKVKYPTGEVFADDNYEIKTYSVKTLLLRYLVNAKGIPLTGKDITYKEMPGGHVYYSNFYGRTIRKLARIFGNNIEQFEAVLKKIGGKKVSLGDVGYRVRFLNNVYMTLLLWEGDEELSPSANILFDANVIYYFDAEDLAVVGEIALYILKNNGKVPTWKGLYSNKNK
ncbi:DUF3786 domain-containing protein [Thermohalobacter berrensis]|uniref:DUF3786 domain-containing protein n=1 Tax=Thermohalobacter berrensis TaxID=99594 RepID=A0A419T8S7_9FIRM|nr:DUF3786 domain-containing protein [Thermohalobacter berrensis]RKD33786.1 hypothetical protein BET03_08670 [Thermohalobacter berrensis]